MLANQYEVICLQIDLPSEKAQKTFAIKLQSMRFAVKINYHRIELNCDNLKTRKLGEPL